MNAAAKHKGPPFRSVNEYITEEVRSDLKAHIASVGAQKHKSYDYASRIGCASIYDSIYRIASAATHTTPRSLDVYVTEGSSGEIVALHRRPQLGEIPERLSDLGGYLLHVRAAFDDLFGTDASDDIKRLRVAFDAAVTIE
jgi:hypothetical protein